MKLSQAQTNLVGEKLGLEAIDPESEVQPQFTDAFGDHSFFVNKQGVFIIEDETADGAADDEGRVYAVAAWSEEQDNKLMVLSEPANVNVTIDLKTGDVQGGA